jgi:hypothetical protein
MGKFARTRAIASQFRTGDFVFIENSETLSEPDVDDRGVVCDCGKSRCAELQRMNTRFVILNQVKNPRVACWPEHGFFTSFRMTGKGQAAHLLAPR